MMNDDYDDDDDDEVEEEEGSVREQILAGKKKIWVV